MGDLLPAKSNIADCFENVALDYLRPRQRQTNWRGIRSLGRCMPRVRYQFEQESAPPERTPSSRFRRIQARTDVRGNANGCRYTEGRRASRQTALPRHMPAARWPVPDTPRPDRTSSRARALAMRRREPFTARMIRVLSADEQPPVVGPPKVVVGTIGVPRHGALRMPNALAGRTPARQDASASQSTIQYLSC